LNKEKTLLFRVNGALHNENSFQDFGYKRNYTIAPSFLYKVSDQLTLTLNTEIYNSKWIGTYYNYSFPANMTNIKDLPIGYKQSLIGDGLENVTNTFNNYLKAEYQLSEKWKSTTTFTTMQNRWEPQYSFGLEWNPDNTYTRSVYTTEKSTFNTLNIQQNFNGEFKIGRFKNRVLVGLDYYNFEQNSGNYGNINYDVITLPAAAIAPISKPKIESLLANLPYSTSSYGHTVLSVYASDVVNISETFIAMLSLRADRFLISTPVEDGVKDSKGNYNQNSLSPKFGLVYQPIKDLVSLFTSYSNGFANVGPVVQADGSVSIFKPEHANQIEIGIKSDLFNHKLSGSLSYFNILVEDRIRRDDATGLRIQDGSQRNSGLELDIQANPAKGFNITAGYSYVDSKYVKVATALTGKTPSTSPQNVANFWASYKFNSGLGLGLGGNYVGKSFGDETNTFIIPEYTIINASVFYEYRKVRLGLKANNLGNVKNWDINYYPQPLRQFVGNIVYQF
jgi:iron complex outermembrane receptor protein